MKKPEAAAVEGHGADNCEDDGGDGDRADETDEEQEADDDDHEEEGEAEQSEESETESWCPNDLIPPPDFVNEASESEEE